MPQNRTALELNSHNILGIQFIPAITWVVMGLFGTVGNFLLSIAIIMNKKCRSNFYICLLQLAISDLIYCFFNALLGLNRVVLYLLGSTEVYAPINCLWMFVPQNLTKDVISVPVAAIVSLDRILAISFPARYIKLKVRRLQLINLVAFTAEFIAFVWVMTIDINPAPLIFSCAIGQIWGDKLNFLSSGLAVVWEVVTIFLYSLLLVVLLRIIVKSKKQQGNHTLTDLKESGQYRSAITGFMVLGVFTGVALSGDIFMSCTNSLDPSVKTKLQPYGHCFGLLATNLLLVICVWRSQDVKTQIHYILSGGCLKKRQAKVYNGSTVMVKSVQNNTHHL